MVSLMIPKERTRNIHHFPDSFIALRKLTPSRLRAYSRLIAAAATDAPLRRVNKFTSPGPYRMLKHFPHPPAKDFEHASQCRGRATCDLAFACFHRPAIEPLREFDQIFGSRNPRAVPILAASEPSLACSIQEPRPTYSEQAARIK